MGRTVTELLLKQGKAARVRGYTREAAIRLNRRHRTGTIASPVRTRRKSLPGLVTIGGPKYFLHPLLGAEEAFLCLIKVRSAPKPGGRCPKRIRVGQRQRRDEMGARQKQNRETRL